MSAPEIPKDIVDEATAYVCKHGRYHADAPKKPYSVRHELRPSRAFIAKDTWELVEQLAQFLYERRTA